MLGQIAAFEFRYQVRRPVFLACGLGLFLVTFALVAVVELAIAGPGGFFANGSYAILRVMAVASLFATFPITALVADSVARDDATGFAPLVHSTPVPKLAYLIGRLAGSGAACLLVLSAIPLAIAVGHAMPWLDPAKLGPRLPAAYAFGLLVLVLPSSLVIGSTLFALTTLTRSQWAGYVGAVGVVTLSLALDGAPSLTSEALAARLDPFAILALDVATEYWTAAERNTKLPALGGLLLENRLWCGGAALALLAATCWGFRFESRAQRPRARSASTEVPRARSWSGRLPGPATDVAAELAQLWHSARFELRCVLDSPAFYALLAIGLLGALSSLLDANQFAGSEVRPVTRLMVEALGLAFALAPLVVGIYFAGELVWRDRDARIAELTGATAVPDWVCLTAKLLAIVVAIALTHALSVVLALGVQRWHGYAALELGRYLTWYVLPGTVEASLFAALAICVQVAVPRKLIGWGIVLLALLGWDALALAGFDHHLYAFASTPAVPLSDMSGADRFWIARAWLLAYWAAFCALLCVGTQLVWARAGHDTLRTRLRHARRGLTRPTCIAFAGSGTLWLGLLGFVYHNTNVLNEYWSTPAANAYWAALEHELLPFAGAPQPRITRVTLDVEIFPREVRVQTRGTYRIENRTGAPLEEVHVGWGSVAELDSLEIAGATLAQDHSPYNFRRYRFEPALQPGEARELVFATTLHERGFPNSSATTSVVANGTYLDNADITPWLGVSTRSLLSDPSTRQEQGLPRERRPRPLEDETARAFNDTRPDSDWVTADITVHTDAGQMPIAPGRIVSEDTSAGRRRVRFTSDTPIQHSFSIQSARYACASRSAGGVELSVYHHAEHAWNVEEMLDVMQQSLELLGTQFTPYTLPYARIVEFPAYDSYAAAYAGTIPFSENAGFLYQETHDVKLTTAHEIAHQWWAHQLAPSDQQGATLLTEGLAEYSALLVMERIYGRHQLRWYLYNYLDTYLLGRGEDPRGELPLVRVEDQDYLSYNKAPLAFYWLREVVGEDALHRALRRLLSEFAFRPAPYPTTRDLMRLLREEAGPEHETLIRELFEETTLYDVRVERARVRPLENGRYQVALDVAARKLHAGAKGEERDGELREPFEIGVFARDPNDEAYTSADVLLLERHELRGGAQTLTVEVAARPAWVGVDPYHKRIDRNPDDNLRAVDPG